MTFGEKIQKLRREKGLSQEDLAEMLAVTRQTISKWELSQSTPELDYIAKLSDIFNVTTDYLIKPDIETYLPESLDHKNNLPITSPNTSSILPFRHSSLSIFGILVACTGMLGITAFIIAAAIEPVGYSYNNLEFHGLIAYLLYTKTLIFFLILLTMVILGIATAVFELVKRHKTT